jgi:hypothetical protein
MSLCTVAELRSALGVGTLYPDATLQTSCDAADAIILPMLWSSTQYAVAHSNIVGTGTLYFDIPTTNLFYVGQSVVIANCGTKYNGTKTITAVTDYSISIDTTHTSIQSRHPIEPFGTVLGDAYTDFTADAAVQEAALMIAVDIWQARQTSNSGGSSPDFQPSPYRMGNTLLARVRGLLAHTLDPRSMVG